jgi:hypothetical protein
VELVHQLAAAHLLCPVGGLLVDDLWVGGVVGVDPGVGGIRAQPARRVG